MSELMSQTEFAEFYGVSQPMVAKYMQKGKIPESCVLKVGKYKKIKVQCAVDALEQNLDPTRRKHWKPCDGLGTQAYIQSIQAIDLNSSDVGDIFRAIDTLSHIQEAFTDRDSYEAFESVLNDLAGLFGLQRVHVEGAAGKLCI